MRLRTFHAASMAAAMDEIRKALGDDAIIVSTRRAGKGAVEVVAAVESAAQAPLDPYRAASEPARPSQTSAAADRAAARQAAERQAADLPDEAYALRRIEVALDYHRLPERQRKLLARAARAFSGLTPIEALTQALSATLRFAPIADQPARSIMLVGPPGVGKTVVTAKLAARGALVGKPLRVITTDTLKAGATAQLEAYLRALTQPLALANSPAELAKFEHVASKNRPAVIDSPGINPFDDRELDMLTRLIAAADVEPILVLAAGLDAHDAMDIARAFARLGVRRLIATRLDATRRHGSLIAAAEAGGLAIAEISNSPFVAQGLRPLDAAEIARLVLSDDEAEAPSFEVEETAP